MVDAPSATGWISSKLPISSTLGQIQTAVDTRSSRVDDRTADQFFDEV